MCDGRIITYQCAACGGVFHEAPDDVPKDRLCAGCRVDHEIITVTPEMVAALEADPPPPLQGFVATTADSPWPAPVVRFYPVKDLILMRQRAEGVGYSAAETAQRICDGIGGDPRHVVVEVTTTFRLVPDPNPS